MSNQALSKAEQNALCVSYDVLGSHVELDLDFVKRYLVRGQAEKVSDQEIVFFMNTCKMQGLNPLVSGDVYLIKFGGDPAQMVVGKDAYLRRAYSNPNYLCKQEGITVLRGNQIIQKEGCCLYPGEQLLGGWCRVTHLRRDRERTTFKEVALAEYNKGQANWKTKPATMIMKVAVSQCVRDAFPKDYEGLYSEEEMIASGAIPVEVQDAELVPTGLLPSETIVAEDESIVSQEQRQSFLAVIDEHFASKDEKNRVYREVLDSLGITSANQMTVSQLGQAMDKLMEIINASAIEPDDASDEQT